MKNKQDCSGILFEIRQLRKERRDTIKWLLHIEETLDALMSIAKENDALPEEDMSPEAIAVNRKLAEELKKELEQ